MQHIRHVFLVFEKPLRSLDRRIAHSAHGPFSIVRYVGRRSGKTYETPIIVAPTDGGFVFELTYGPEVDWYKNVVAAGDCTVLRHGKNYVICKGESLGIATDRTEFPRPFGCKNLTTKPLLSCHSKLIKSRDVIRCAFKMVQIQRRRGKGSDCEKCLEYHDCFFNPVRNSTGCATS